MYLYTTPRRKAKNEIFNRRESMKPLVLNNFKHNGQGGATAGGAKLNASESSQRAT